MGLSFNYSICSSQMKYKTKNFWLKASVLYEQLLSSVPALDFVPFTVICLCSLYTEQSINYFGQR